MGKYIIDNYNEEIFDKIKRFIKFKNGNIVEKFKDPITLQQYYKVEFDNESITIDLATSSTSPSLTHRQK